MISFSFNFFSQKNYVGVGFIAGYKSTHNQFGVTLNSRIKNHLDFDFGVSLSKFSGVGYSTGVSYAFLDKKVRPIIGVQYTKTFGVSSFNLWYDNVFTEFNTNKTEYFYVKTGVLFKIPDNGDYIYENSLLYISLSLSYRKNFYSNHTIHYVSGSQNYPHINRLNNRIGSGWGGSVSFIFLIGKKN